MTVFEGTVTERANQCREHAAWGFSHKAIPGKDLTVSEAIRKQFLEKE